MFNNNLYIQDNNIKLPDAINLLERLLNSDRKKDVLRELENIKIANKEI